MTSKGTTPDTSASDTDPDTASVASGDSDKSKSDYKDDSSDTSSNSDRDNDSNDDDDDEEEEEEEEESEDISDDSHLIWSGPGRKVPIVSFSADALFTKIKGLYHMGDKYHLAYKMVKTECRLIRQVLSKHGFHEAHPNSSDFNLMWTGSHVKPFTLRSLTEFQKVNHFPRSYELTRKDRLYKNIQRMQHSKGMKHFDFIPQSFVTPSEFDEFHSAHMKDKSTWIVKPIASSRGRGIFLINHPQQLPLDETLLVARYIHNPLCIDGFKFDLRLYVAVTSYDPVRIYIYEEGLTRFATVQYEKSAKSIRNTCMHLTNYSLNKKSSDYVRCDDPNIEDYGNKWSLGAMLRYIKKQGRDVTALMSRIQDVVIKTILAGELPIATACKMFMPNRGNCFELYGFDILVDDNLKAWLLEVNLSPSLACDAPLDMKIKANMIADLFTLTGFVAHDPMMRKTQQSKRNQELAASSALRQQKERVGSEFRDDSKEKDIQRADRITKRTTARRQRPQSAGSVNMKNFSSVNSRPSSSSGPRSKDDNRLTGEEARIVRETKEECSRRGGWVRVFPSPESWEKYSNFLESRTTHNEMLHRRLYPDSVAAKELQQKSHLNSSQAVTLQMRLAVVNEQMVDLRKDGMMQYLRKLTTLDNRTERRKVRSNMARSQKPPSGRIHRQVKEKTVEKKESNSKSKREPLAQGELKEEKTRKSSSSSQQQQQKQQQQQQQQQRTETKTASSSAKAENQSSTATAATTTTTTSKTAEAATNSQRNSAASRTETENIGEGDAKTADNVSRSKADRVHAESEETRQVLREKPQPPQKPPLPKVNVVEIIENGGDLSKLQARHAFATYLQRVQLRLIEETSRPHNRSDPGARNDEQMVSAALWISNEDLVLRFLKRAAGNLQQPFKVIVPSRKLPINDRRRILAKQLGDFVHIYSKETEQLQQRRKLEKKYLGRDGDLADGFDEDKFRDFIHVASESELEEVLTVYTKMNKSASIFLGTSSKSDVRANPSNATQGPNQSLLQRRSSTSEINKVGLSEKELGKADLEFREHIRPKSAFIIRDYKLIDCHSGDSSGSMTQPGKGKTTPANTADIGYTPVSVAYASTASIYSTKTAKTTVPPPPTRSRPCSAKSTQSNTGFSHKGFSRPSSAVTVYRDNSGGEIAARHFSESSEQAIQEALHRLARRQAARQYSASSLQNQNLVTQQYLGQYSGSTSSLADSTTCPGSLSASRSTSSMSQRPRTHSWEGMQSHSTTNVQGTYPTTAQNYISRQVMSQEQISQTQSQLHDLAKMSQERMKQQQPAQNEVRRPSVSERSAPSSATTTHSGSNHSYTKEGAELAPSDLAKAYNTVIGVAPQNNYQPSPGSYQLQYALQQQLQAQQQSRPSTSQLLVQSRPATAEKPQEVLNDHTRAKHQAKIAQAHTNMSQQFASQQQNVLVPKPPIPTSTRKPISVQRMARTTHLDNGYANDRDFYSSVRYNTSTGTTKPVQNVGYSSTGHYLTRLANQWKGGGYSTSTSKY
ncbi:tubulin polyglutamylase TTLL5-like isoform X6 [Ptychodera flava]|uniref:tubulin polyglutamylase TTLL5-like isoform X6 n=1 Tax=Ptychodera flava TaxID=63121 RepID=UPI00396A00BA